MSDRTSIEWTDATWNIVNGCSVVSPGCTNCYAMRLAGTRLKHHKSRAGLTIDTKAGPVWNGVTKFNDAVLLDPLKWRRPRKIFVCAHGDLFHESVPDEWIDRVFAVMALAPQHVFQVLTKRPERMREWTLNPATPARIWAAVDALIVDWDEGKVKCRLPVFDGDPKLPALAAHGAAWGGELPWPLRNVWKGTSVEDQKRADERIPILLDTPAAVRWLSCEPLLGSLDLQCVGDGLLNALDGGTVILTDDEEYVEDIQFGEKLDWVVAGGESGPGARPMHPDWARSLRDQCAAAGVPFLFKQWGEFGPDIGPDEDHDHEGFRRDRVMEGKGPCAAWVGDAWQFAPDGYAMPLDLPGGDHEWVYRLGKKRNGRLLDGVQHDGYPA